MSKDSVKTQIDLDITNKTTSKSITPSNVGNNMKAVVDLIPDNISKTNGNVDAISGSKATLQYNINTVNKDGGSEVKLPTTTEVGKEVLFLASNYAGTVSVYVNDAEDVKLSGGINGISGSQSSLQINANEAYRFISLGNEYWYFEKIDTKDSRPYKVYTALLTQTGTNVPTAVVLENTLGINITFAYSGVGIYAVYAPGTFTVNKTFKIFNSINPNGQSVSCIGNSINGFDILTRAFSGLSANDVLVSTEIEIRVYN